MFRRFIFLQLVFIGIRFSAAGQDLSHYEKRWLVQGADTLPYRILLPLKYDSSKQYPVLFFLHGAAERGRDNEKQLTHGGTLFLQPEVRSNYPAIVIFPQCAPSDYWGNALRLHNTTGKRNFSFLEDGSATWSMELLLQLIRYILTTYSVEKKRVYVGGLSMGGMGTYEVVRRMPGVFAAAQIPPPQKA